MSCYKYNIFYLIILLIGLNFYGSAIMLSYILLLFTLLFIRTIRKVPYNFIIVIMLVLSILVTIVVIGTEGILFQILKLGVYINIYLAFYLLTTDCSQRMKSKEYLVKVYIDCIFFFSLGNMIHLALNVSITDIKSINLGYRVLNDYWSGGTAPTTVVLGWGCFILPVLIYYYERFKEYKIRFFVSTALMISYIVFSFQIATRFGVVNSILILGLVYVLKIQQKEITINVNKIIMGIVVCVGIVFIGIKITPLILKSNLAIRMTGDSLTLFSGNGRLEATVYLLQHWSEAMFGGGYFTSRYGLQQHNIVFQIYDLYGMIPFLLLLVILSISIKNVIKIYKFNDLSNSGKRVCMLVLFALFIYLFEEPAFSSNFIITSMLFAWVSSSRVLLKTN